MKFELGNFVGFWLPLMGSVLFSFLDSFVKAFQTRNIADGKELASWLTSWLITLTWVSNITFALAAGFWVLLSAGIGGSFGVLYSIRLHKRLSIKDS